MTPRQDFFNQVDNRLRVALRTLRPLLLEAHGIAKHHLKPDKTVVTEMDLMVERRLRTILASIDPNIPFGGEETGVDWSHKTFWLVDPIDGTEAFIRGLPFWTSMVTLIDNRQPLLSVIYNYFLDEYYLAIKGQGATCNGHPIKVSDRPMDRAFVVFGGRVSRSGLVGLNDQLRDLVKGMPKMNASGYEFSAVARGALDGIIVSHRNGHPWDFAPGTLLVQEAGGRVENFTAPGYDYLNTEFIAANPVIFDELMAFMKSALRQKTA